jgi:hypothetical protein
MISFVAAILWLKAEPKHLHDPVVYPPLSAKKVSDLV